MFTNLSFYEGVLNYDFWLFLCDLFYCSFVRFIKYFANYSIICSGVKIKKKKQTTDKNSKMAYIFFK